MPPVPNIFYPAAAPYLRREVALAAHMVQVTRRMDDRREAAARALAYQHALRILLNSPEGASSEYGVAEVQYLPSDALEDTRVLIGDAEFTATGYEAPADEAIVAEGQVIGAASPEATGNSTGPHLHLTADAEPEVAEQQEVPEDDGQPETVGPEPAETAEEAGQAVRAVTKASAKR
jgi:hypothetical protein